jgi:hypothetical protein
MRYNTGGGRLPRRAVLNHDDTKVTKDTNRFTVFVCFAIVVSSWLLSVRRSELTA